jgi:hypothetical protein
MKFLSWLKNPATAFRGGWIIQVVVIGRELESKSEDRTG